jgi:hypothetical protein
MWIAQGSRRWDSNCLYQSRLDFAIRLRILVCGGLRDLPVKLRLCIRGRPS